MPVIGYLGVETREASRDRIAAFLGGLAEAGFVDGRNVVIEYRLADDHYDRLPALAADLVRRQVAIIVALGGVRSALAAKAATTTIPILFNTGGDPVKLGLVASLNRPGGNLTGAGGLGNTLVSKQLQLMRELLPKADSIGFLVNPDNPNTEFDTSQMQMAARTLGLRLDVFTARQERDPELRLRGVGSSKGRRTARRTGQSL